MASGLKPSLSSSSLWTSKTREIMAMEFLLGIPLEAEANIVRQGLEGDYKHRSSKRALLDFDGEDGSHRTFGDEDQTLSGEDPSPFSPYSSDGRNTAQPNRWWEKIVSNDSSYIQAESQRAKLRARTRMEMEVLEAPNTQLHNNNNQRVSSIQNPYIDDINHSIEPLDLAITQHHSHVQSLSKDNREINVQTITKSSMAPSSIETSYPFASGAMYLPAPSRRLEGRQDVTTVCIPREAEAQTEQKTRHVVMARQATVREWEQRVLHLNTNKNESETHKLSTSDSASISTHLNSSEEKLIEFNHHNNEKGGLLDGRIFFSFQRSYPIQVFSVIKYEPEREEALRKRKKLEDSGGGGMEYILPVKDWRGISYRALLLRRKEKKNKSFNRNLRNSFKASKKLQRSESDDASGDDDIDDNDEVSDTSSISSNSSSDESTTYVPGFLDDPEMVQGRHRHVMIGDSITGCIVSSTILFVPPIDLKAELNKQFRIRFDGWEPPKSQRKYIGAKIIDNVYTLDYSTEISSEILGSDPIESHARRRKMSIVDMTLRIPPSLTLSKIRSVKQKALIACVREMQMEVSTVALACVYFERLCLDCRVDKSNRRISFAACLLLAAKINESNVAIVHDQTHESTDKGMIQSWIRPTKKQHTTFLSLFDFFTREWSISLKNLFDAEWCTFSALQFSLHASPSQVAFHFKRLMKALEWSPINYLSKEMYDQWQSCLIDEQNRKKERKKRQEQRRKRKEFKLLNLQREISASNRRKISDSPIFTGHRDEINARNIPASCLMSPELAEIKHFNRLCIKSTTQTIDTQMLIPRSQSQPLFTSFFDRRTNIYVEHEE